MEKKRDETMENVFQPLGSVMGTETLPEGLRGDYARARPDGTLPEANIPRSEADHATWRTLVARQRAIYPRRAASAWLKGLDRLRCDDAVPVLRMRPTSSRMRRAGALFPARGCCRTLSSSDCWPSVASR